MKYQVSVSVADINESLLERMAKEKVGLELSFFAYPENLEEKVLDIHLKRYQKLLKDFPEKLSMHGAFYDLNPTAREPKIVEVTKQRIIQSLDIAQELGINLLVFHANYFPSKRQGYKSFWIEKQYEFWQNIIPEIEKRKQSIFIENIREEDASYLKAILEKLNHPQIKTCYDTGHSFCFTESKLSPDKWVKTYGNHLGYIHLHSNHGELDEHLAFTKGTQNFDAFFEELQKLEQQPHLIIEVKSKEDFWISLERLREMELSN